MGYVVGVDVFFVGLDVTVFVFFVGDELGTAAALAFLVGSFVGVTLFFVGETVTFFVGDDVAFFVGIRVGANVAFVGLRVGATVAFVGFLVGGTVGFFVPNAPWDKPLIILSLSVFSSASTPSVFATKHITNNTHIVLRFVSIFYFYLSTSLPTG